MNKIKFIFSKFFKNKKIFLLILLILLMLSFFVFGIYLGINKKTEIEKVVNLSNKNTPENIGIDFEPFWKTWNILNEKYPSINDIEDQEKIYGAISGLVNSLNDPYTNFLKPEEKRIFEEDISGSFVGLGMEVGIRNKILTVISPLKDTPAYKAQIKAGDIILKINDTLTSDLTIDEAVTLMRGEKGTEVSLTILRSGKQKAEEIKITRDIINIPTLDTEITADNVFIIKLYSFSANSAQLFKNALLKFSEAKTDKLLLDLRGNPGGYLDSAVSMASWFLPSGKAVVIEDYGKNEKQKIYRSKGYNVFNDNLKFVILIDEGSASASEILAGAMQDHKKAKIVGAKSYGKGSIQEVVKITSDSILKITVAKWLTPNGNSISEKGLMPDYVVPSKEKEEDKDLQMDKAVELLNNWNN
jgi:carboxyl-terminal processing protease